MYILIVYATAIQIRLIIKFEFRSQDIYYILYSFNTSFYYINIVEVVY